MKQLILDVYAKNSFSARQTIRMGSDLDGGGHDAN